MNKTQTGFKTYLTAILVFLIGIVLAVSIIGLPVNRANAASTEEFVEPQPSALALSNSQFESSSGSAPSQPTSWTGGAMGSENSGNTVSGVVSLSAESYNAATKDEDVYKLKRYPEYEKEIPKTPFGTAQYPDTNRNVLMINTVDTDTAYAYTSETLTFSAGAFYRVSAYVKTGNFKEGTGAAIKLNGLPEEVAFKNINTVKGLASLDESNMFGFKQYTFYVAAPLVGDSSVTLSLQVGDRVDDEDKPYYNPAKGYAFFDNVKAEQIPANTYKRETGVYGGGQRDNYIVKDFTSDATYLTASKNADGGFDGDITYLYTGEENTGTEIGSFENGFDGWTRITDVEGATANASLATIYNTSMALSEDNIYGFTTRPVSPVGDLAGDSNVLLIHSSQKAAVGYRSPSYKFLRNTYYRLTYWVKTDNINGSSGATAVLRGTNGVTDDDNKLRVAASMLTGDTANTMRYGWKMYSFYIKGSALRDYEAALELWLGQPDGETSGTVMYDEVKIEKISPAKYNSDSSNGTIVTFDPTFEEKGVTNGNFMSVGEYEEYKYPLIPAGWTEIAPDTAETAGFSSAKVDSSEDAVRGIISTDIEHFEANRANYNNVTNPTPGGVNLLMLSSLEDTAVGYRSPAVTATASSAYKFTATIKAHNLTGYGANLVLKSDKNVVATIENIKDTGDGFRTYTFYVEGGAADKTLNLEIWLGLNDRKDNKSKLAAGTLFVREVAFEALEENDSFDVHAKAYDSARSMGLADITEAAYTFNKFDMSAYDYYGNDVVKTAYNWSLTGGNADSTLYGIFDGTSLPQTGRDEIPSAFRPDPDSQNNGVLYLHNFAKAYSQIQTVSSVTLAENSYYRVNVRIKVDLPSTMTDDENVYGAGISLTNTDFEFKNIKSTATVTDSITDNETFKTYTFYVKTSQSANVGLAVSLGDNRYTDRYCLGRVYVSDIKFDSVNNVDYDNAYADYDEDNPDPYTVFADLSTGDENSDGDGEGEDTENPEEEGSGELAWWLIPSILFAVALLIAVIGTVIRRLLDKRAEKKEVKVTNSYDRKATLHKIHNAKSEDGANVEADMSDDDYENFDDTASPAPSKDNEKSESVAYDDFDEFDDSKSAEVKSEESAEPAQPAESESEKAQTEPAEDDSSESAKADVQSDEAKADEQIKPAEEKPVKAAEEKTVQKPVVKAPVQSDAYLDEFED